MKTIKATIEGVSPLLINRFKEQDEVPVTIKKGKKDYGTAREQAENTAYRDAESGRMWVPSMWIKGALATVASDYKLPGTRKSVKSVIGGAVIPVEEKLYFKEGHTISDAEVDSRPAVVQRARIMRHRAKLERWSIEFEMLVDDTILETSNVQDILVDAGKRSGIGDYRPQKGGPFGRFNVVSWQTS